MHSLFKGVASYLKNSFIDYPGTVSAVLFFSGCNLRCPFCHNSAVVTKSMECMDCCEEIPLFLQKRRNLIHGVVLSGGEPTIHPHICDTAEYIRKLDFKVKLDTNGLRPDIIRKMNPDYLALDIKTLFSNYQRLSPVQNRKYTDELLQSLEIVRFMKSMAEVRIPVATGFINEEIIYSLAPVLKGIQKVYLQPVALTPTLLDPTFFSTANPVSDAELETYRKILSGSVQECHIRSLQ